MPKYTIIEQPLQSEEKDAKIGSKKLYTNQEYQYVERLRQVLQNSRRSHQYHPPRSRYQSVDQVRFHQNNGENQNRKMKRVSDQNRFETEREEENEEDAIYIDEDGNKYQKIVKLPKLKKKNKQGKPLKESEIHNNEREIIKNYMNAKLIQFKNPRKSNKLNLKNVKLRSRTLDSIGQLPPPIERSNNRYLYKVSTPIDSLKAYYHASEIQQQKPKQFSTQTENEEQYYIKNNRKPVESQSQYIEITPRKEQTKNQSDDGQQYLPKQIKKSKKHRDVNVNYKNKDLERDQFIYMQNPNKNKEQGWQIVDPLNLQTFFYKMKKVANISVQNTKIERQKMKIPKIPRRQEMSNFIKNYVPEYSQIMIDILIKEDSFQIIQDETQGNESFYFGETNGTKREGKGIFITNRLLFQGIWANDLKLKGIEITQSGKYKGDFKDGIRSGKGQFFWTHGQYYEGQWKNGKKNGSGYWKSTRGENYIGEWKNGQVTGYGVHTMKNGQKYEGQFVNFLKHGFGREQFPNGDSYEGRYVQGHPHGKGKYFWKNGVIFEGDFLEGQREGKGILTSPNRLKFEGTFRNQQIAGSGRIEYANGDVFTGLFKNNKRNGQGILDLKTERRIIKGFWANNQLVNQDK